MCVSCAKGVAEGAWWLLALREARKGRGGGRKGAQQALGTISRLLKKAGEPLVQGCSRGWGGPAGRPGGGPRPK